VSVGVSYIPLLYYAVLLLRSKAGEMAAVDRSDMRRLRRQQLWPLAPFAGLWSLIGGPPRS
jgi:hypothetical protein